MALEDARTHAGREPGPEGGGVGLGAVHGDREVPGAAGGRVGAGGDPDLPDPGAAFTLAALTPRTPARPSRTCASRRHSGGGND